MNTYNLGISACRHCRNYTPEGRRGGHCSQFNSLVKGHWTACQASLPPFAPSWETLGETIYPPVVIDSSRLSSPCKELTPVREGLGCRR